MAGLVPAILAFPGLGDPGGRDVDARNKSGQSVPTSWMVLLDPALSQLLNWIIVERDRA